MADSSLFAKLEKEKRLLEVDVDDVKVLLPGSSHDAIGTKGLNGCTCVVIIGKAILLAHISPLPGRYEQWEKASNDAIDQGRHNHHQSLLETIAKLVKRNQHEFPASDTAWGIFAGGPKGSIRSVQQQIQAGLTAMGFSVKPAFYEDVDVKSHKSPKGELVGILKNGNVELYLESEKLWPAQSASASQQQAAPKASGSGSNQAESSSSAVKRDLSGAHKRKT